MMDTLLYTVLKGFYIQKRKLLNRPHCLWLPTDSRLPLVSHWWLVRWWLVREPQLEQCMKNIALTATQLYYIYLIKSKLRINIPYLSWACQKLSIENNPEILEKFPLDVHIKQEITYQSPSCFFKELFNNKN